MIEFINSWAKGIIIAVIITTIIEMLLPEGNIKKYVRTVMGVYIVSIIISPIVTKITGKNFNLEKYKLPETSIYDVQTINTNSYIESTYIDTIKKDIEDNVRKKGYKVNNIEIDIDLSKESYGNLNKISFNILNTQKNISNNIEPVEINLDNQVEANEKYDNKEIEELKSFLNNIYGVKKENIIIY